MDVFTVTITISQVVIGIIAVFLLRLYLKTKYAPVAVLSYSFFLVALTYLVYIPVFWIPISGLIMAAFLSNVSLIPLIIIFPLLITAFEGMKGRFFSPIAALYLY